jgi:peptidylprolyl isomerase
MSIKKREGETMKLRVLILLVGAVSVTVAGAQTPAKTTAKTATHRTLVKKAMAHEEAGLPAGIPPVHGVVKTEFALRYQDIKLGTGAEAEPGKLYEVFYSVWIASDGRLLDSTDQHREALKDADGKPVLDADGKPKLGSPQPIHFVQGVTHLIPGFAEGFEGMRVGGKRRLFIPWQLAYGAEGRPGPNAANPGVPPKADLIFDVELVKMENAPPMNGGMMMPGGARPAPQHPQ